MGHLSIWGDYLSVLYIFTFSYRLWASQVKNAEMVCHSPFQWASLSELTTIPFSSGHFVCLGWLYMAWLTVSLSYTKLWSVWSFWLVFCDCGAGEDPWESLGQQEDLPGGRLGDWVSLVKFCCKRLFCNINNPIMLVPLQLWTLIFFTNLIMGVAKKENPLFPLHWGMIMNTNPNLSWCKIVE